MEGKPTIKISRDDVQRDAVNALLDKTGDVMSGSLFMGTGTGKTKTAINAIQALRSLIKRVPKTLWVVPTEQLRDVDHPQEFMLWEANEEMENTTFVCYSSLAKIKDQEYDIVVMDECHHVTPANAMFFINNTVHRTICMSATFPEDDEKAELIQSIAPIRFTYSLEDGIDDEIVKNVNFHVCFVPLGEKAVIEVKTPNHHFFTSETRNYTYLSQQVEKYKQVYFQNQTPKTKNLWFSKLGVRSNLIYTLPSKIEATKKLLLTLPQDEKILVFGKRIKAIESLEIPTYHSGKGKTDEDLADFKSGKINRLAVVDALNEGVNVPSLKTCVIMNLDSKRKNLIQRVGRAVRKDGDHEADVFILISKDTQDERWFRNAIGAFKRTKINYFNIE